MRYGISAGCLVDLQTRAAGIQALLQTFFPSILTIQIFLERKARRTDGCRCETGGCLCVLSLCHSGPGAGVLTDPGLTSALLVSKDLQFNSGGMNRSASRSAVD